MALEDPSNLYVFIFGPTGMGKDTLAGDYVAWESAPDRSGLRVAWFMETGPFSKRRLGRLARYLTDPASYRHAPEKTPGGQIPSGSLIADYGPFEWKPGMVWEDGSDVDRPEWTSTAKYYVRSVAPEQDPSLWATGVEGAAYGSRIGIAVCSDIFTKENQKSPTERQDQYEWIDGTLDTRLDEDGRLVVIGTWLPVEHNYELLLEAYTADARMVREVRVGPGVYTKYSNGVAVVVVKAIYTDDDGNECSYWPERFPLNDHLHNKATDERVDLTTISDEESLALSDTGYKRVRGLRSKRSRSPLVFKAMFQQERDKEMAYADFTEETLALARDYGRSFGIILPHEIKVLGVDPAKRYGAGWVLWAVDLREKVLTVADFWWGERLGITGIKEKLILKPLARFNPVWLCYEDNKEGSVLADSVVWQVINESGVSVFPHTTGLERGHAEHGPGALATWMQGGMIKIPYMTGEDKARAGQIESHFKAWDASSDRSKPGRAGHQPDDLAMAAWVGWLKAGPMIDVDLRDLGIVRGVPAAIKRHFDRRSKEVAAMRAVKRGEKPLSPREALSRGNPLEMLMRLGGEHDD
jgi:hypothetical protein